MAAKPAELDHIVLNYLKSRGYSAAATALAQDEKLRAGMERAITSQTLEENASVSRSIMLYSVEVRLYE